MTGLSGGSGVSSGGSGGNADSVLNFFSSGQGGDLIEIEFHNHRIGGCGFFRCVVAGEYPNAEYNLTNEHEVQVHIKLKGETTISPRIWYRGFIKNFYRYRDDGKWRTVITGAGYVTQLARMHVDASIGTDLASDTAQRLFVETQSPYSDPQKNYTDIIQDASKYASSYTHAGSFKHDGSMLRALRALAEIGGNDTATRTTDLEWGVDEDRKIYFTDKDAGSFSGNNDPSHHLWERKDLMEVLQSGGVLNRVNAVIIEGGVDGHKIVKVSRQNLSGSDKDQFSSRIVSVPQFTDTGDLNKYAANYLARMDQTQDWLVCKVNEITERLDINNFTEPRPAGKIRVHFHNGTTKDYEVGKIVYRLGGDKVGGKDQRDQNLTLQAECYLGRFGKDIVDEIESFDHEIHNLRMRFADLLAAPTGADYVVGTANADLTAELVLGTAVVMRGTIGARPAAGGVQGRLYHATDSEGGTVSRDSGNVTDGWQVFSPPLGADYVVGTASAALTAELVLKTAVIMRGTLAARPATGIGGRLYQADDQRPATVFRDSGDSTLGWQTFADKAFKDGTDLSIGSIPFSDNTGHLTHDNAKLFWDDTSDFLGIGNKTPTSAIDLSGAFTERGMAAPAVSPSGQLRFYFDSSTNKWRASENGGAYVNVISASGGDAPADADYVVGTANATLSAELVLGTSVIMRGTLANRPATGIGGRLYMADNERPPVVYRDSGDATLGWQSFADRAFVDGVDLSAGDIPFANASGRLTEDSANLSWDSVNTQLRIGTATSAGGRRLYVVGDGITAEKNNIGTTFDGMNVFSLDNTNSASHVSARIESGGASGGDPYLQLTVGGTTPWLIGVDNSDSDSLKFDYGTTVGSATKLSILTGGNVGIGTTSPSSILHLVGGTVAARSTGITLQTVTTDATLKEANIRCSHFTNSEEEFLMIYGFTETTTSSSLYLGGGSSAHNAATDIRFFTAANSTTLTGSSRLRIDSSGFVSINRASASTYFHIKGDDNATASIIEINATQANVTTADIFMDFQSLSGSEGTIAGTAVAGVIAYNTFTGSHWSQSDAIGKTAREIVSRKIDVHGFDEGERKVTVYDGDIPAGTVLVSVSKMCVWVGEITAHLPKCEVSSKANQREVYGVYGGHDRDGDIMVLGLGAGIVRVCAEGGDVAIGDLLSTSSTPGVAMKYTGTDFACVIGKARQSFSGIGEGLIACSLYCG